MADDDVTLGLARALLSQVSPAEMPLLEAMGPELLAISERRPGSDGALGFGVDEFAWAVAVLPISNAIVDFMVDRVKDVAAENVKGATEAVLRRWRNRAAPAPQQPPPVALPPDLVAQIQQAAYRHSLASGLDDTKARLLADAVRGAVTTPVSGLPPTG